MKDVRDGCTYDGVRLRDAEDDYSYDVGRVVRDGYTYNGMRVVGDGAADPLNLHQDQNKRHHSQ